MRRVTFSTEAALARAGAADGFVRIAAGTFKDKRSIVHVDAFELAVQPVTNAEYCEFVEATGHAPPAHWEQGRIPTGWDNCPVVFVNIYDAAD